MDVIDFGQVLHAIGDAAQHTQKLQNLELAVIGLNGKEQQMMMITLPLLNVSNGIYPEESVERSVLHVLGDDHDGIGFGDDALQVDHVRVLKLAHY